MKRRCKCAIYVRDTYRYSGRGPSGFTMHYKKKQCSRAAIEGSDFCGQHAKQSEYTCLEKLDWHQFVEAKPC